MGGEVLDTPRDGIECLVERRVGADPDRVRNRPVTAPVETELLVRGVAARDDPVTLFEHVDERRGVIAAIDMPWRFAAASAPRSIAAAGWVPAEATGTSLACCQSAAASWDRAEFAVQTNTIRLASAAERGARPSNAPGTRRT